MKNETELIYSIAATISSVLLVLDKGKDHIEGLSGPEIVALSRAYVEGSQEVEEAATQILRGTITVLSVFSALTDEASDMFENFGIILPEMADNETLH